MPHTSRLCCPFFIKFCVLLNSLLLLCISYVQVASALIWRLSPSDWPSQFGANVSWPGCGWRTGVTMVTKWKMWEVFFCFFCQLDLDLVHLTGPTSTQKMFLFLFCISYYWFVFSLLNVILQEKKKFFASSWFQLYDWLTAASHKEVLVLLFCTIFCFLTWWKRFKGRSQGSPSYYVLRRQFIDKAASSVWANLQPVEWSHKHLNTLGENLTDFLWIANFTAP